MREHAASGNNIKTILIVEDDEAIGDFLTLVISEETPYQVLRVQDGFRALEVTQKIRPNLLILDYNLPRMNGIVLYDRLPLAPDIPTIMVSADLPEKEVKTRKIIGMHKPLDLDELLNIIGRLLH